MKALIAETGIQRLGKRMQLRQAPIATAMIYYQRFYVQLRLNIFMREHGKKADY